jgi:hypothetical protein
VQVRYRFFRRERGSPILRNGTSAGDWGNDTHGKPPVYYF